MTCLQFHTESVTVGGIASRAAPAPHTAILAHPAACAAGSGSGSGGGSGSGSGSGGAEQPLPFAATQVLAHTTPAAAGKAVCTAHVAT